MGDWRETLDGLACCEKELGRLGKELEALPTAIEQTNRRVMETRQALEAERETCEQLERSRREQEAELQDCESRRDRFRSQTAQVKTNEEYTALLHEIDAVTQRISDLEEGILVAMEEVEERSGRLPSMKDEQDRIEADSQERVKTLKEQLEQVRQEIQSREEERERYVARFDVELQAHYRRVLRARGEGVTRFNGRTCAACYREIPYETVNRVSAGEIHTCPSCQRILVEAAG